ncbi:hypothetical protein GCM10023115_16150 [Pontixanthobacter gangjinensis]|uniref:Hydrolase 1, exosortase A system-associated n=1 Tax=Pontixanthobacter gangjinensis TaxID=1028742 RepID=A0A6I4SNB4_9SPHN|nr:hydrolase 1, exosortase A system-associated [Pontixanthobacter gangjinensis]MXO56858.1 hydrolase 1, exosortase A system-associated [Pontixanthobacter gangjinensis]
MSRLHLTFECQQYTLAGTLDTAPGKTGLLIVSGGNEIRSGAFSGQADIAARIASAGFPVFRFDRRGIGDSDGENRGFRRSAKDISAALDAFRAINPQMDRVVGFGNCDAASALMLAGGAECDGLILSNPWTIEQDDGTPPPAALRARYLAKLKNPKEIMRLLRGGVNFRKLFGGLKQATGGASEYSALAQEMQKAISKYNGFACRILLAKNDRTAQAFVSNWLIDESSTYFCEGASHAYVEQHAQKWLEAQILEVLRS